MTEDEMVGWHHQPNGHEFEQSLGDKMDSDDCSVLLSRNGEGQEGRLGPRDFRDWGQGEKSKALISHTK